MLHISCEIYLSQFVKKMSYSSLVGNQVAGHFLKESAGGLCVMGSCASHIHHIETVITQH